jgi:5-methylcytosine-specific restriction endonuclease McrA
MLSTKCEVCGIEIVPPKRKFCSSKCRRKEWKIRNRAKENEWMKNWKKTKVTERLSKMPFKKCPLCGKEFHPLEDRRHPYKTYCSSRCQVKFSHRVATKRRNEILKNPSIDPISYKKHLARKKVQDCNYKAFSRGCTRDDENHISLKSWLEIKEKHGNKCALCRKPESKENEMTIDHTHPISKGGKNNKDNIQPACWRCNSEKGDKIISIPHTSL